MSAAITPQNVRDFANLPSDVPNALLNAHIEIAGRDLARATGVMAAPVGLENEWSEALIARALASVFPWLNTFAMDGAAKVARLAENMEYRFLDTDDVAAKVNGLNDRFQELAVQLTAGVEDQNNDETPQDQVAAGDLWFAAV